MRIARACRSASRWCASCGWRCGAPQDGGAQGSVLAGWLGLGCILATVVLLSVPYRILRHNLAERAQYGEFACYVTARSNSAFLLFCPTRDSRVLSVNHADPALTRQGDRRLPGLLDGVEVGASGEKHLYFGRTTRTMFRVSLEPRATFTLGTLRDEQNGNPWVNPKIRVGTLWVLPGFDPADFGALPGPRLGPEVLTSVRLVVDLECYRWRRGHC